MCSITLKTNVLEITSRAVDSVVKFIAETPGYSQNRRFSRSVCALLSLCDEEFCKRNHNYVTIIPNERSPMEPVRPAFGAKNESFHHNKTNYGRALPNLGLVDNTS